MMQHAGSVVNWDTWQPAAHNAVVRFVRDMDMTKKDVHTTLAYVVIF
jgi:hypothetical protein